MYLYDSASHTFAFMTETVVTRFNKMDYVPILAVLILLLLLFSTIMIKKCCCAKICLSKPKKKTDQKKLIDFLPEMKRVGLASYDAREIVKYDKIAKILEEVLKDTSS